MPFTTALVVGGIGAAQGMMQARAQKKANEQQAMINAAQTEYSPWTGITPGQTQVQPANAIGSALSGGIAGGLAGYMQSQAGKKAEGQDALLKAQTDYYKSATPAQPPTLTPGPEDQQSAWMGMPNYASKLKQQMPGY